MNAAEATAVEAMMKTVSKMTAGELRYSRKEIVRRLKEGRESENGKRALWAGYRVLGREMSKREEEASR